MNKLQRAEEARSRQAARLRIKTATRHRKRVARAELAEMLIPTRRKT
ncbi:MAG: hypothetical protein ACRDHG_04670 [Anaerolineales bacterium]